MTSTVYLGTPNQPMDIMAGKAAPVMHGTGYGPQRPAGAYDGALRAAEQFANVPDAASAGRSRRAPASDNIPATPGTENDYITSVAAPPDNLFSRLIQWATNFIQSLDEDKKPFNPDQYQRYLNAAASASVRKFSDASTPDSAM